MRKSTYEKHKHLIGTQINKWTILDIVEHRGKDKGYIFATCQCVCGTIRDVRLSKLLHNKSQDCGCGHDDRRRERARKAYEHMVNNTINGWTLLDIIPPDDGRHNTFALCMCQCGTVKIVNITHITSGKSKDCGCGRKDMLKRTLTKDLTGQRIGKLVVIERLKERNKYGRIMYRCQCDCGKEVIVLGYRLAAHLTLSCGCLISYWNMYIGQLLRNQKIDHKTEYTVHTNGTYYRFDFYLPDYNLFIEYDGQQHYQPVRFFGTDKDAQQVFERTQANDKIKNRYCEENNINLLRIPYWEQNNIETIINNYLQRLNTEDYEVSAA